MEDVCPKCGLPLNLCICQQIAKEQQKIKVRVVRRRFGKNVTIVSGLGNDVNINELCKVLKRTLACGGTVKNDGIELQGYHRKRIKEILLRQGFKGELIDA